MDWVKSSFSSGGDNCVEVGLSDLGAIAFRHSKFPESGTLWFSRSEMSAFVAGAKNGEFDEFC